MKVLGCTFCSDIQTEQQTTAEACRDMIEPLKKLATLSMSILAKARALEAIWSPKLALLSMGSDAIISPSTWPEDVATRSTSSLYAQVGPSCLPPNA